MGYSRLKALKELENPEYFARREAKKKAQHEYYLRNRERILKVNAEYRKTHPITPEANRIYHAKDKYRYRTDEEYRLLRIARVRACQERKRAEMGDEAYRKMCCERTKRCLARAKAREMLEKGEIINFNV